MVQPPLPRTSNLTTLEKGVLEELWRLQGLHSSQYYIKIQMLRDFCLMYFDTGREFEHLLELSTTYENRHEQLRSGLGGLKAVCEETLRGAEGGVVVCQNHTRKGLAFQEAKKSILLAAVESRNLSRLIQKAECLKKLLRDYSFE